MGIGRVLCLPTKTRHQARYQTRTDSQPPSYRCTGFCPIDIVQLLFTHTLPSFIINNREKNRHAAVADHGGCVDLYSSTRTSSSL